MIRASVTHMRKIYTRKIYTRDNRVTDLITCFHYFNNPFNSNFQFSLRQRGKTRVKMKFLLSREIVESRMS